MRIRVGMGRIRAGRPFGRQGRHRSTQPELYNNIGRYRGARLAFGADVLRRRNPVNINDACVS